MTEQLKTLGRQDSAEAITWWQNSGDWVQENYVWPKQEEIRNGPDEETLIKAFVNGEPIEFEYWQVDGAASCEDPHGIRFLGRPKMLIEELVSYEDGSYGMLLRCDASQPLGFRGEQCFGSRYYCPVTGEGAIDFSAE